MLFRTNLYVMEQSNFKLSMFLHSHFSDCYFLRAITGILYEWMYFECSFDRICYNWHLLSLTWRLQFYVTSFCQIKNSLFIPKHYNNHHHQLDAVFVIRVFRGSISCPSIMDVIGLWVPTRKLRKFSTSHICPSWKNCPSSRRVTAGNSVRSNLYIFRRHMITLRFDRVMILLW